MLSQTEKQNIISLCDTTYMSVKYNPADSNVAINSMLDYFSNASYDIINDKDIMLAAVKASQNAFKCASSDLQKDISFIKEAVKANPGVKDYLSPEIQKKLSAPAVKRPPFTDFAKAIEDAKARAAGQVVDKPNNPNKSR